MKISERTYKKGEVLTFSKTTSNFGGLSNMASGFSLFVNETNFANSEILYQVCRFPLFPEIQEELVLQTNPMEAKATSRKYTKFTRQDWENVKFDVMKWCLNVKLIQNYTKFSELLLSTGDKTIVEYSLKDDVWGATPAGQDVLKGKNALGRLLTELREVNVKSQQKEGFVAPLNIPAFLLFNNPIEKVYNTEFYIKDLDDVYV